MKKIGKWICLVLVAVFCFTLFACAPKTLTKGSERMRDAGYTVEEMSADEIFNAFGGLNIGAVAAINCEKMTTEDALFAVWFDEKDKAKAFEGIFDLLGEQFCEQLELSGENITIEYDTSGKVFYFGTEQACKDFK